MGDIERPTIETELRAIHREHRELDAWRAEAEFVLAGQDDTLPAEVRATPWDQLDEAGQRAAADRGLLEVVLVGGRLTVASLVHSGLSAQVCNDVEAALAFYRESLPLDGGEQFWLKRTVDDLCVTGLEAVRAIIEEPNWEHPGKPVQIVTGGMLQTVDSAAMVSRLWDWMREGGNFSGRSSYRHATRKYLQELIGLFGDWRYPASSASR